MVGRVAIVIACLALAGCATRHAYRSQPDSLGAIQWQCDSNGANCEAVQMWQPSQLTPAGCALHKVVTFGHTAEECKKATR